MQPDTHIAAFYWLSLLVTFLLLLAAGGFIFEVLRPNGWRMPRNPLKRLKRLEDGRRAQAESYAKSMRVRGRHGS